MIDPMSISAVIPVLNERELLPSTLSRLSGMPFISEIIVVDAGSTDGTRECVADQPGVRLLDSECCKGTQLNRGAEASRGEILLFLHADCILPANAGELICQALADRSVAGGAFAVRFAEERSWALRVTAAGINARTRLFHSATGDQALFARRSAFEQIGGFPDWPLFEDVEFSKRVKRAGRFAIISPPAIVSGRRHISHGVLRTVARVYALRLGFILGISPFVLKRWFSDARRHTANEPSSTRGGTVGRVSP